MIIFVFFNFLFINKEIVAHQFQKATYQNDAQIIIFQKI